MSETVPTENGQAEAEQLVVGATLPPSGIDRVYVHVQRDHKVLCTYVPPELQILNAPEWQDGNYLKNTFTKPHSGTAKPRHKTHLQFPYCLLVFGPAATSLRERLIVINWWLNLSKKEQKDVTASVIRRRFLRPSKSSELILSADPNNPKAIGSADTQELREEHTKTTHAHKLLKGGPMKRQKVNDLPKTNAQLRDLAVRVPEARALCEMQSAIRRSSVTDENSDTVRAHYEPVMTTVSTAYTPEKRGRPSKDVGNNVRSVANVNLFGRSRDGLVRYFEPFAQAIRDNKENLDWNTLNGEALVQCLENSENHTVHYCGNDEPVWSPVQLANRLARRSGRSEDNVNRTETIADTINRVPNNSSEETGVFSMETYWGLQTADY